MSEMQAEQRNENLEAPNASETPPPDTQVSEDTARALGETAIEHS